MTQTAFVFVSQPTALSPRQLEVQERVMAELQLVGLEPRTVGVSDFVAKNPLHEVCVLARHCSGGIILGFRQSLARDVVLKPDTNRESTAQNIASASPWNQLEAGVLFAMRVPLLVVCEIDITGGVFDPGAGDHFVNRIDLDRLGDLSHAAALRNSIRSWSTEVWNHYRNVW